MAEEAGEDNLFLFGLTAQQVAESRSWYNPDWHYDHEPETRAALDLIFSDYFSRNEPGIFALCVTRSLPTETSTCTLRTSIPISKPMRGSAIFLLIRTLGHARLS
ncbi:MAG: glycogen/starch/alpha-glucan phosphorylase [Candidatus Acidiferrum sp.]